jgi:predicted DNA-binding transcriptional regulator AlpA
MPTSKPSENNGLSTFRKGTQMNTEISNIFFGPDNPKNKSKLQRVYRKATICQILDVSSGTVDNMVQENLFVQPIKIGARSIGFLVEEVEKWLQKRIAERDSKLASKVRDQ